MWAFSQSKLGASIVVACGLNSCGRHGLRFSEACGIVHRHVRSSRTRSRNNVLCIGRQTLNHWTPGEVLSHNLKNDFHDPLNSYKAVLKTFINWQLVSWDLGAHFLMISYVFFWKQGKGQDGKDWFPSLSIHLRFLRLLVGSRSLIGLIIAHLKIKE